MARNFPKNSIVRRVNNEPAIGLAAGRALLLQVAHPAVAQGVTDHSDFQRNPFKRLQGTLEAMYSIVNGSAELAGGIGRRVRWIHEFVVGPTYRASDPENLLWVHATLTDSALLAYTTFVGPLAPDDAEAYYQQMKRVAEPFGLSEADHPKTLADFRAYFDHTVAKPRRRRRRARADRLHRAPAPTGWPPRAADARSRAAPADHGGHNT